jgi:hypothetical protein
VELKCKKDTHIIYDDYVKGMSHQDKEKYVEDMESRW